MRLRDSPSASCFLFRLADGHPFQKEINMNEAPLPDKQAETEHVEETPPLVWDEGSFDTDNIWGV